MVNSPKKLKVISTENFTTFQTTWWLERPMHLFVRPWEAPNHWKLYSRWNKWVWTLVWSFSKKAWKRNTFKRWLTNYMAGTLSKMRTRKTSSFQWSNSVIYWPTGVLRLASCFNLEKNFRTLKCQDTLMCLTSLTKRNYWSTSNKM